MYVYIPLTAYKVLYHPNPPNSNISGYLGIACLQIILTLYVQSSNHYFDYVFDPESSPLLYIYIYIYLKRVTIFFENILKAGIFDKI